MIDSPPAASSRLAPRVAALATTLLALLLFATGARAAPSVRPASDRPWIFAADIHLDPTGRYGDGTPGSDSNPALLASAIQEMRRVDPDPPVVVLDGDFLAHAIDDRLALPTMRAIASQFDRAFPRAQFVFALGNEDSNCGDYGVPAGSAFLHQVARAWEPLVNRNGAAPDFLRTFPADGFYIARLPLDGLRAIVIDDVFWSPRYRNACGGSARPGLATLRDLDAALRRLPASHAWTFVHIPPGIDAYSTAYLAHRLFVVPFLDPHAKDAFVESATAPSHGMRLIVAAHTHKFAFRVAGRGAHAVPILLVPSISPIFRNAPSFLTVRVDASGTIVSAQDWTRLAGRWADRGGLDSLAMRDISVASIDDLQDRLARDPALRATFAALYEGGAPAEITPDNWRVYWCAATNLSATPFRSCMNEGGYSIVTARGFKVLAIPLAALAALTVAAIAIVVTVRRRRRAAR